LSIPVSVEDHDFDLAGTWSQRAWTLQERHLSRRRLYFGYSRVYLHCSADELREPLDYYPNPEKRFHNSFLDQVLHYRRDRNIELLQYDWENLIQAYVHCQATYKTDVFPAISGLVRIMAAELDDTYIAGLWKKYLPRGLLWTNYNPSDDWDSLLSRLSPAPSKQYIAPSWSWASIDDGYEPPRFTTRAIVSPNFSLDDSKFETEFRSECRIAAAWCVPVAAELDVYGQITHSELHVEAKLKECGSTWVRAPCPDNSAGCYIIVDDISAAACTIDFSVPKEAKEMQLNNVFLLLLSSSCGYNDVWPRRRHYEKALGSVDMSEADPTRLTYLKMSQRLDNTCRADDDDDDDDEEEEEEEEAEEEGDDDDDDDEDPEQGTDEVSKDWMSVSSESTFNSIVPKQHAKQRNAWGLLVHPVADTDKFVRVGVFRVSFEQGGLRCFDDQPGSLIKLI
jgi:hypothetical protein